MLQRRFRLMELLECGGMEDRSVLLLLLKCYTLQWIQKWLNFSCDKFSVFVSRWWRSHLDESLITLNHNHQHDRYLKSLNYVGF